MYIHMLVRVLATATVRKRRSLRRSRAAALAPHATPTIDWRRCPRAPLHARSTDVLTTPDASSGRVLYSTDLLCACLARPQDTCLCGLESSASASVAPDDSWLDSDSDAALVMVCAPGQHVSASSPRLPRQRDTDANVWRQAACGFLVGVLLGLLGCALVALGMVL